MSAVFVEPRQGVSKSDAQRWIETIAPAGAKHLFAAKKGDGRLLWKFGAFEDAWPWLVELNADRHDIYYLLNETKTDRRRSKDIIAARGVALDFDEGGLPDDLPARDGALICQTSQDRFQAVWPAEELSLEERDEITAGLLEAFPGADKKARDRARLLRLPGTLNWRHGAPQLVRIIKTPSRKLTREDLDALPHAPAAVAAQWAVLSRELSVEPTVSVEQAWEMLHTINKAMAKGGGTSIQVKGKDETWPLCVKSRLGWRKFTVSLILVIGNLADALDLIDEWSRGDYLSPGARAEVRKVYNRARNLSIYRETLSAEDFADLTGEAPVTPQTFFAVHRAAREKIRKATPAVHAKSNETSVAINRGLVDPRLPYASTHALIMRGTRSGTFREFLLWLNETIRANKGQRYAVTEGTRTKLCEKFGIEPKQLHKWMTLAKRFFNIAPARYSKDRTAYAGWLHPDSEEAAPGRAIVELFRRGDTGAHSLAEEETEDSARYGVTSCQPLKELSPFRDYSSLAVGGFSGGSLLQVGARSPAQSGEAPDQHSRTPRCYPPNQGSAPGGGPMLAPTRLADSASVQDAVGLASEARQPQHQPDLDGLQQLVAIARSDRTVRPPEGFQFYLVERDIALPAVEGAIHVAWDGSWASKRQAEGVGAELWHVLRSRMVSELQLAAIIARANRGVAWRIANGQVAEHNARAVLKAYRKALAWAANDAGVWTPGADKIQRSVEWKTRKEAVGSSLARSS